MRKRFFLKKRSEIDLTPMIDIIFLILIFFIVGASFDINRTFKIKLPEAMSAESSINQDKIVIEIDKNNMVSVDGEICNLNEINNKILNKKINENTTVYIVSDEEVKYKTIIYVMDNIKIIGLTNISLITKSKE